jgi:hypothetical protein
MNKNAINSKMMFLKKSIFYFYKKSSFSLGRIISSQNSNPNLQSAGGPNLLSRIPSLTATNSSLQQQQQQNQLQQLQQLQNKNLPPTSGSNPTTPLINQMNNPTNNNSSNNNLNPSTPAPQIQHQLIESFRLAVTSGLLSADLLNTRLPSDVLSLLYQLFQVK